MQKVNSVTGQLLIQAANEISSLRNENDILKARTEMFDNMMLLFKSLPNQQQNGLMHPDIVYELNKMADIIKIQNEADKNQHA